MTWNTFWNFKAEAFYMLLSHFRAKPHTPAASGLICTCVYEEQTVLFEVKVHRRGQKAKGSEWLHRNTGDNSRSLPFFLAHIQKQSQTSKLFAKGPFWFLVFEQQGFPYYTHTHRHIHTYTHTRLLCYLCHEPRANICIAAQSLSHLGGPQLNPLFGLKAAINETKRR